MLEYELKNSRGIKQVKNISDPRFDYLFVSFSLNSPKNLLENNVVFKNSGCVVVDNGYQAGNSSNRFWLFKIINGQIIQQKMVHINLSDNNMSKLNKFLSNFLTLLEFSGYNNTDLNSIRLSAC